MTGPDRDLGSPYAVEWTPPARRRMARLPLRVAEAILTFVDHRLALNPMRLTGPLRGELAHLRSAHHGHYRVLVAVDEDQRRIYIHHVDHRAHAYRP